MESQVASARDERDRVALWSRILPITFTAIGLVALVGGALLGSFSLRAESALIDPGLDEADHGFFGTQADTGRCRRPRPRPRSYPPSGLDRLRTDRSDRPLLLQIRGGLPTRWHSPCWSPRRCWRPAICCCATRCRPLGRTIRCRTWPFGGGAAGCAAGFRDRAGLASRRRRRRRQGAAGGRAVAGGLGLRRG